MEGKMVTLGKKQNFDKNIFNYLFSIRITFLKFVGVFVLIVTFFCIEAFSIRSKKTTLVSGNANDEKNLHPDGPKFIFFNRYPRYILFSFLVSFAFFCILIVFFFCLFVYFLKLKIYILIHILLCGRVSDIKFSPDRFPETRVLFLV